MLELTQRALVAQFEAGLVMLAEAVERCDAALWLEPVGERPFWENAWHVAFYVDLYLTPSVPPFPELPDWAWPGSQGLGRNTEPPFDPLTPQQMGPPVPREAVRRFITGHLRAKLAEVVAAETEATLAGPSGFFWLPFTRLEAYHYNLRHLMHHTGQLCAALRGPGAKAAGLQPAEWAGSGWRD